MRQLDHSLLDLIILDWREVLKEADWLENVDGKFTEHWAFQLQVFKGRLIVHTVNMLFTGLVIVICQDVAGNGGRKSRNQWI
jgi:hypothetical protein